MSRALLALIVVAAVLAGPLASSQEAPAEADCQALLAGLEYTLGLLASGDPSARSLALEAVNATLPDEIAYAHRDAYTEIAVLAGVVEGLREGSLPGPEALYLLDRAQTSFPEAVNRYSNLLLGCSENRALAGTLKVRADRWVDSITLGLIPSLVQQAYQAGREAPFRVEAPDLVVAGQEINVTVAGEGLTRAQAYLRPVFSPDPLSEATAEAHGGVARLVLEAPTAEEASAVGYVFTSSRLRFYLVVEAEGPWGEQASMSVVEVEYTRPRVGIVVDPLVVRGESLTVVVNLFRGPQELNATLTLDGTPLENTTLRLGANRFIIDTGNLSAGYHRVGVLVPPQGYYSGVEKDTVFAVVDNAPRVELAVSNPSLDLLGRVRITATLRDQKPVVLEVYVSGRLAEKRNLTPGSPSQTFLVPGTLLPVWREQVEIVAYYASGGGGNVTRSVEVFVVNPVSMTIFIAISVPTIILFQARERAIITGLASRKPRPRPPRAPGPVTALYLRVLESLGLGAPRPWETLREHLRSASRRLNTGTTRRLWRLLVMAEEELYSPRSPDAREAERIARETAGGRG